jgi:CDP-diacylglycerol--serine O-phosphatidyltransferase
MELRQDQPERHEGIRRVVVVIPSAFTLGNLFFGFWAIVQAFNGNFRQAGWFIVFAGILDSLDGRVARRMGTGSRFGAELDSLVDVISFGVAPALLIYFLEFSTAGRYGWIVCFLYLVAVALRLARFNVLSHGKPTPGWFTGLPSPAAGMTLATYYAFSQTKWYRMSVAHLDLEHQGLVVLLLLLAVLMVSKVMYPRGAPVSAKTPRGIVALVVLLAIVVGSILYPSSILFPFFIAYASFGVLRHIFLILTERGADE